MSADDQHLVAGEAWRRHASYLVDLAFRMLGDIGEAEDIVQEAFSRFLRAQIGTIEDDRGWLIVVTSRMCLDHIRSARSRRQTPRDFSSVEPTVSVTAGLSVDPADRVTLDESVKLALLVMLERLSPAERVVYVLHDVFQVPFETVATTVGRTVPSCRQMARRARLKIERPDSPSRFEVGAPEHQVVTRKFIAACADGDFDALVAVLDPDVSGEVDIREDLVVVGADRVATNILRFWGRPATLVSQAVTGQPSLLAFIDRKLAGVILLSIGDTGINKIHVIADPPKLRFLESQLTPLR
jgi:RNA polymerase sigma-70 factor (ECF subfamily)